MLDDNHLKRLQVRTARPDESQVCLERILGHLMPEIHFAGQHVANFKAYLAAQQLEIDELIVVEREHQICASTLAIHSPGRVTMVLIDPPKPEPALQTAMSAALNVIAQHAKARDTTYLQCLMPAQNTTFADTLREAGFKHLADLRYLALDPNRPAKRGPPLHPPLQLEPYCAKLDDEFVATLAATYHGTLDCPDLAGARSVQDAVDTHRASGIHDPNIWYLARCDGEPVGVLLLTRVALADALELIYVGVTPHARGRGYGRWLVEFAIDQTQHRGYAQLSLAVDQRNHYAMEIYSSLGFTETERRSAWIRQL